MIQEKAIEIYLYYKSASLGGENMTYDQQQKEIQSIRISKIQPKPCRFYFGGGNEESYGMERAYGWTFRTIGRLVW